MTNSKIVVAKAKAFTAAPLALNSFRVDLDDGSIEIFDDVAGRYTQCYSLSASQKQQIRRLAGYVTFPYALRIAAGFHCGPDRLGDLVSRHRTYKAAQNAVSSRQDCEIVGVAFDGSFYKS